MKLRMKKLTILFLLICTVFVVSAGISPPPAYAAAITVDTADDNATGGDSDCTL